ncbi:MAG: carboxylating nicotinate-nucleotide diphosphorylase [Acidobacteria bacterium]|nr:carboxylating nicotinate-nucleotide diphosphorylase [Acidobacteriota bacterium]
MDPRGGEPGNRGIGEPENPAEISASPRQPDSGLFLERWDTEWLHETVQKFLEEDVGPGDLTTRLAIRDEDRARAAIIAREEIIVAGMSVAQAVFHQLDSQLVFEPILQDGVCGAAGGVIARLRGRAAPILTGERVALNLLQRLSGIATLTRHYVNAVAFTGARIFDTRKNTPGLRQFEKYAVRVGGGHSHRAGLYDAVLIKDNHVSIAGGVGRVLRSVRARSESPRFIQIEVESVDQVREALEEGVDALLLDNMTPEMAAEAVTLIRSHPKGSACRIEASGGISLNNVRSFAEAGVDAISVGALTHSARAVDLALEIERELE